MRCAIDPGDTKSASAQPATNMVWTTIAASDIIEVHGQNHVRMYIDPAPELPVVERWLCFKDGGCVCPAGERYSGPELEDVSAGNNGGFQQIDFWDHREPRWRPGHRPRPRARRVLQAPSFASVAGRSAVP